MPQSPNRLAREAVKNNALLWGIGNGLISTALITYLIRDICAGEPDARIQGTIAWIIAAPRIVGLLRILTPRLIERCGSRKTVAIAAYLLSPLVLLAIPLGVPPLIRQVSSGAALGFLVLVWCAYHVIEYFGTTALWSWIGDLTSQRVRGRFLGQREAYMIFGQTLGFLAAGLYSKQAIESLPQGAPKWEAYALPAYCGVFFLLCAAIPLLSAPEMPWKKAAIGTQTRLAELFAPLRSATFLWFVLFGVWVQIAFGLPQTAFTNYRISVLGISLLSSLGLQTLTRIGQFGLGPTAGRWIDRFGYFRVLGGSFAVAACGSLFYFFAEESSWWLIGGAAVVWIFWVGINIGLSALVLNVVPAEQRTSGIALFYSATTLSFALATLGGGYLADGFRDRAFRLPGSHIPWDYAHLSFFGSFVMLLLAIAVLAVALRKMKKV